MCSHKVSISSLDKIDAELIDVPYRALSRV